MINRVVLDHLPTHAVFLLHEANQLGVLVASVHIGQQVAIPHIRSLQAQLHHAQIALHAAAQVVVGSDIDKHRSSRLLLNHRFILFLASHTQQEAEKRE